MTAKPNPLDALPDQQHWLTLWLAREDATLHVLLSKAIPSLHQNEQDAFAGIVDWVLRLSWPDHSAKDRRIRKERLLLAAADHHTLATKSRTSLYTGWASAVCAHWSAATPVDAIIAVEPQEFHAHLTKLLLQPNRAGAGVIQALLNSRNHLVPDASLVDRIRFLAGKANEASAAARLDEVLVAWITDVTSPDAPSDQDLSRLLPPITRRAMTQQNNQDVQRLLSRLPATHVVTALFGIFDEALADHLNTEGLLWASDLLNRVAMFAAHDRSWTMEFMYLMGRALQINDAPTAVAVLTDHVDRNTMLLASILSARSDRPHFDERWDELNAASPTLSALSLVSPAVLADLSVRLPPDSVDSVFIKQLRLHANRATLALSSGPPDSLSKPTPRSL